jgi:hypothetical protein
VEQTSFITDGEIEWVKVKMKNNKDLLVGSFYMPHIEQKHLDELSKSLEKIENHNITNIVLTRDFNSNKMGHTNSMWTRQRDTTRTS